MLNKENILALISQEEIMYKYFGPFLFKHYYTNPWRPNDRNPGCWFTYRNNILYFVDFGNNIRNMNCFQICMYKNSCDYFSALEIINKDFNLKLSEYDLFSNKALPNQNKITDFNFDNFIVHNVKKPKPIYTFEYQNFTKDDVSYWKSYKYTKELCELMKIRSVNRVYENNVLWKSSYKDYPIYTYSDSKGEFKIYQPYGNKFNKWRSIRPIFEGFELLNYNSDILFIASSYKDVGCLKLLNYEAFAPNSETSYNELYEIKDLLKKHYKYIYVFFDTDNVGKKYSLKITKELDFNYINIPNNYINEKIKDPSDLVKKYGLEKLQNIINKKLERDNVGKIISSSKLES